MDLLQQSEIELAGMTCPSNVCLCEGGFGIFERLKFILFLCFLVGAPPTRPQNLSFRPNIHGGPCRLVCCSSQISGSSSWLSPAVVAQSPASRRDARATEEEAVGSEVPQATSSELMGGADLVAVMMLIASSRPETAVSILVCEKKSWVPYK